jgi:adenine-specific DNA-methyltransferase
MEEQIAENRIWFGETGNNVPRLKRFLHEVSDSVPATTWWDYQNFGHNDEARRESKALVDNADIFATPKPERLLERILTLSTNPGDLVLDSFAGSGTTGAVAHKMGRRWIMIELGEHCHTHIIPRLKKVIDGEDQGGISKAVNWQGGGGFRYYRLAPSLLQQDRWGQWVINKEYNAEMLAAAICKLEGFTYAPSDAHYWQHGTSTEKRLHLRHHAKPDAGTVAGLERRSRRRAQLAGVLFGVPGAMQTATRISRSRRFPRWFLSRCEWGHDDYSLNVENLPMQEKAAPKQAVTPQQAELFEEQRGKDSAEGAA